MAGFIKIRYNANGFLKNRIINAESIDAIEPCTGPAGRYVDETRSRIFMRDGTKYDMSNTVDEIQQLLQAAGSMVAEIHSKPPARKVAVAPAPAAAPPVALYKRSAFAKPATGTEQPRKTAENPALMKQVETARKLVDAMRR